MSATAGNLEPHQGLSRPLGQGTGRWANFFRTHLSNLGTDVTTGLFHDLRRIIPGVVRVRNMFEVSGGMIQAAAEKRSAG